MRRCSVLLVVSMCVLMGLPALAQEKAQQRQKQKGDTAAPKGVQAEFKLPDSVKLTRDICFAQYGDRKILLDLYLPKDPAKPAIPCIVVIHGGGWRSNDKSHFGAIASYMAEHGFAAVSIDYRLLPEVNFPDNIMDCKAAVRWVRANAKQYGIDPDKIGAIGGSAGGHLVCMLGSSYKDAKLEGEGGNPGISSRVQAVVSMAGPTDMTGFAKRMDASEELAKLISPITYVDADSAPTLFLHGVKDNLVPMDQAEIMAERLTKAGVYAEIVKEDGGHGFWNQRAGFDRQMPVAVKFFGKYLGSPHAASSASEKP